MIEPVSFNDALDRVVLVDQTRLPQVCELIECSTAEEVAEAIVTMKVRGAPAIGVAAAYGVYLGLRALPRGRTFREQLDLVCDFITSSRPTAVNLFWAVQRVRSVVSEDVSDCEGACSAVLAEAKKIHSEDLELCIAIGNYGADLIKEGQSWLTHCNAGALATAGHGTALGVFRSAHARGRRFHVYVDETRPLLQGARLTAWEMVQEKIDATLICDNMAGSIMARGKIAGVIVGADRITSKGFAANKIGTYSLAVLAKYHSVPFYVTAPFSTFDSEIADGSEIRIEERSPDEVRSFGGVTTAPASIKVFNPAFDVTPPELITAFITDGGILTPPFDDSIPGFLRIRAEETPR